MTVVLHPPSGVTFEGDCSEDDRRALEQALLAAVVRAVADAAGSAATRPHLRVERDAPSEPFDPARVDVERPAYLIPSYEDEGKLTPAALLKRLPQARPGFRIIDGDSPLQDALVASLPGNRYITLGGSRYGSAGTLNEALAIGNTIFGTTSFVVVEGPFGKPDLSYLAIATNDTVTAHDLDAISTTWGESAETELPPELRGQTTPMIGGMLLQQLRGKKGDYLLRGLVSSGNRTLWWASVGLAALWVAQVQAEAQQGVSEEEVDRLRVFTFDDIDALIEKIEAGDDTELQHAAEMLSALGVEAFALVGWQTKVRYLKVLLAAWTWQAEEVAVVAIFKSLRSDSEVDAVVAMLKQAGRYDQLFDDLDSEVYDLLATVGERFPRDHGPLTFGGLIELFQSMGLLPKTPLEALTTISEGPYGPIIPGQLYDNAHDAVMGFIHFGEDLLLSIKSIFTDPDKMIEGIGALVQLVVKVSFAQYGYPPAQKEVGKLLEATGEKLLAGMRGADRLGCGPKIVRRIEWRMVWEIASLFIGVGEVKAAIQAVGLSEKFAAVARFLSVLARLGEAVDTEAEALRLARLAEMLEAERTVFTSAEEVTELLARLPDNDVRRLGGLLAKVELKEGETLADIAARSPELRGAIDDAVAKAEVLKTLADKAGALTNELVEAFQALVGENGVEVAVAERLVKAVPEGEGARFAGTLRRIPLGRIPADVRPGFLELLAASPTRMDAVAELGVGTFGAVYRRTGGDAAQIDRYLLELKELEQQYANAGKAGEYRQLLDRLEAGDAGEWGHLEYTTEVSEARRAIQRAATGGTSATAESLLSAAVGDSGEALGRLTPSGRIAAAVAAEASPGLVRRIVGAETEGGLRRALTELEKVLRDAGMSDAQVTDTLDSLEALNREQNALRAQRDTLATLERIRDLDDPEAFARTINERIDELTRRAAEFRKAGNVDRARQLEADAARVRQLAQRQTRLTDINAFQDQVKASKTLFQHMQAGGGDTLRRLWVQYWSRGRTPKVSFERYVEILAQHFRGNFGEFEVAFRLGDRYVFLKAPDALVTLPGTDLVVIPRGGGDILLIDNKAFSASEVDKVNALTRNLPRNLDMDLASYAKLAGDPSLPAEFQTAVARLQKARNEIQAKFGTLTRAELEDPAVQADIGRILQQNGIRRVVTNAGGEVTSLSPELTRMGIDLLDVN